MIEESEQFAFTRRRFLQAAALTAAHPLGLFASTNSTSTDREPLRQFDYSQVQLTEGPFAEQYKAIHAHYLSLSNDRLLKVYRQRAGLPAPGVDMGGWYDLDGFVPGHSLGQYISGLARIGASTGDEASFQKVKELVEGFAATLGPDNQSILRPKTNLWICYTLDKHFVGLIDAAALAKVPSAKDILNQVLAGSQALLPLKVRDRVGKKDPPYDEPYVMPENLFAAAELTGNPAFRELAERYLLDRDLFDPLARGADPFPGQHAYSHVIALSSGARAYLTLGELKYKKAMENAFTLLTTQQQFASGGWGPNETFITPHRGELYNSLSTTVDHFETPCGAYAATKLARYLTRFTANPQDTRYGDNMERVLYNTILAVKFPDSDGDYPYYSTYSPVATKVYYQKKWPCCSGTLIQTVADYPLNIFFHADQPTHVGMPETTGLYVNQYIPSRLKFTHAGITVQVTLETRYPIEDTIYLSMQPQHAIQFTVYLRIPGWLTGPTSISINGKSSTTSARPGTFATLRRKWQPGDRIQLTLPQSFRIEPIDEQHPTTVALMRGPVQYVAVNPTPRINSDRLTLPAGLKQVSPESFVETYSGNQIVFVPLHKIRNESYTSYFSRA